MFGRWCSSAASGSLGRRVAHDEIERAGRDFAKARVAVEGDRNADGRVLAGKTKAAFEQAVVNLVDVQWSTFFTQQQGDCLWNGAVHEAVAEHLDVVADDRDLLPAFEGSLHRPFDWRLQ